MQSLLHLYIKNTLLIILIQLPLDNSFKILNVSDYWQSKTMWLTSFLFSSMVLACYDNFRFVGHCDLEMHGELSIVAVALFPACIW